MKIKLTSDEYDELKRMHKKSRDSRERDKIKAISMLSDGYTATQIAHILFLDEDTVLRWKNQFLKRNNLTDWLKYNFVGYSGKLNAEDESQVKAYVIDHTISDSKQVQQFIKQYFNVAYTESGVIALLHRLGFVYKKTTLIPSKYDAHAQANFKKTYEELEKNLKEDEVILHLDGVHPQHNTTCSQAWILKGETKEIKSNTGRERLNLGGAYNPKTMEAIMLETKTINAEAIIELFKLIEDRYKDKTKIYGILDNARYHRSKLVRDYLKTSRIELIFLPPYSPNLNLIERLWKFMRKKVINNRYYEKFPDFRVAIKTFFDELPCQKDELKAFIGTKLHLLQAT